MHFLKYFLYLMMLVKFPASSLASSIIFIFVIWNIFLIIWVQYIFILDFNKLLHSRLVKLVVRIPQLILIHCITSLTLSIGITVNIYDLNRLASITLFIIYHRLHLCLLLWLFLFPGNYFTIIGGMTVVNGPCDHLIICWPFCLVNQERFYILLIYLFHF